MTDTEELKALLHQGALEDRIGTTAVHIFNNQNTMVMAMISSGIEPDINGIGPDQIRVIVREMASISISAAVEMDHKIRQLRSQLREDMESDESD